MPDSRLHRDDDPAPLALTRGGFGLKGVVALVIAVAAIAALAWYARSFFLIVIAAAVGAVVFLHFWNKRPVKTPEDDQIRLNLDK